MPDLAPSTDLELAAALAEAAKTHQTIRLGDSQPAAAVTIRTGGLNRILKYEPRDLTISVEAGVTYADLTRRLTADGLMLPLDPPWASNVTIGGLVSANLSGPRRRLYGTVRDLVIGMRFATLEGALVDTGGMVVKNVAGLDMAKMLIGSHGTLAAIASVNFKLIPLPKQSRTLVFEYGTSGEAFAQRDTILKSILPAAALDVLNPAAAERCGCSGWTVALRAVAAVARYGAEFPGGRDVDCRGFWDPIQEFTPRYLGEHPGAVIARYSTTHTAMRPLIEAIGSPAVARAGSGVVYGYQPQPAPLAAAGCVMEHAPPGVERWPVPGRDFALMQRVKQMFDPHGLLNQGALYGRI